jgi:pimeloyl-ACP methyl ester carboxylesterase
MMNEVIGRYIRLSVDDVEYRIYYEQSGQGIPIIMLHTAGADSRQFMHLLEDQELQKNNTMIAFDFPFHGRSNPPDQWWNKEYKLTTAFYREITMAFIRTLGIQNPIVMGCSMGGLITFDLAYRFPDEIGAFIPLEAADKTPGRFNEYLNHPQVDSSELSATWTYSTMAPQSPEQNRRENWWIYSQGSPGVYYGDIYFYSEDFDGKEIVSKINTEKCPVFMLTGEYDYSCPWTASQETAKKIPGAKFVKMEGIGHFPMIENPERLKLYLLPVLEEIRSLLE